MSTERVPACRECRYFKAPNACVHPIASRLTWDYLEGTQIFEPRPIWWMRADTTLGNAGPCGHEGKLWEAAE